MSKDSKTKEETMTTKQTKTDRTPASSKEVKAPATKTPTPKSAPGKKPTKKLVRESLAQRIEADMLTEADMQQNITTVLAVQVIPDKLKTMAETLAKIEGTDLMPLSDQLRNAVGPGPADRFYQTVTQKVRELLDAVKSGKDAIDAQITNLQAIASGEPGNDMANDLADDPTLAGDDAGAPEMDGPPAPDAGAEAPEADAATPPAPDLDAEDDLPPEDEGGAAGRLRKESVSARRLSPAIRALRESANPDALVFHTFRVKLKESRGKTIAAVMTTAKMYEIDASDVVSIIREAKASAKRPFNARAQPLAEAGVGPNRHHDWVSKTLNKAKVSHILEGGTVYVSNRADIGRAQTAMKANSAVDLMPIKVRESTTPRKAVKEAVPVKPMSPADLRAAKQQGKDPNSFAHDQSQQQSSSAAAEPLPIQTPGASGPKAPTPQSNSGTPAKTPELPGNVMKKVTPVVGGQPKPTTPQTMSQNTPQTSPANAPQNGSQTTSQNQPAGTQGDAMQTEEGAEATASGKASPTPVKTPSGGQNSVTLFSKMSPLPPPKHELMGAVTMPTTAKVSNVAEGKTTKPGMQTKASRTEKELASGLRKWVADYQEMRKNGNVKGAKSVRDNIEKKITDLKLDAALVWGKDPEMAKD